jgi:hypothetical protein
MRPARIYKDNIRENILRSLLFTNQIIIGAVLALIAGVNYLVIYFTPIPFTWGGYISSIIIVGIAVITPLMFRIDGQPVYILIPRSIKQMFSNKKQWGETMHSFFSKFHIQDNAIFRSNNLIRIYQIEPRDVALLSDQDKANFYEKLRTMLHMLPIKTQFIVRREIATSPDFSPHFFSMYKKSNSEREELIYGYIEGLKQFIDQHNFLISKHYAVFAIECQTKNITAVVKGMQRLNDIGTRFLRGLNENQITARPLNNHEIISFMQKYYR